VKNPAVMLTTGINDPRVEPWIGRTCQRNLRTSLWRFRRRHWNCRTRHSNRRTWHPDRRACFSPARRCHSVFRTCHWNHGRRQFRTSTS